MFEFLIPPLSEVWNADLLPSNDRAIGAESISLSYDDVPSFSFKRALNMMEAFWGALERINYFSELFESNESTMEKSNKNPVKLDSLKTKVSVIDIRFREDCYTCGTPIASTKDTTIINTKEAKSSLKKHDSILKEKASTEWRRQLDSILNK